MGLVAVESRLGVGCGRFLVHLAHLYATFGVASMVLKSSKIDNVREAEESSVRESSGRVYEVCIL